MSSAREFPTWGINSTTNQSFTHSATTKVSRSCFVDDSLIYKGVKLTAYAAVFLISLVLNSLTVYLVWSKKSMRKTINYFIVNMAISDLLITSVYMPRQMTKLITGPRWIAQGIFGDISCKVVPTLHMTAILASILTLLAISVDRFNAVVFPMRFVFTRRRVKIAVVLIWLVSTSARLPYFFALQLRNNFCSVEYRKSYGPRAKQIYLISLLATFCIAPLLAETILYSIAIVYLKCQMPPGNETTALPAQRIRQKAAKKLLKLTCSITVGFVVCWTPYFIAQIAYSYVPCHVRFWRFFLAHSNSALNPVLCVLFNREFRQGFKRVLCARCVSNRNQNDKWDKAVKNVADQDRKRRQGLKSKDELITIERVTVI